jgi:filamentous hemagglutinin family protein
MHFSHSSLKFALLSSVSYFHIGKRNLQALTAGVTAASLVVSGVSPAFAQDILPTNGSVAAGSVSIGSSGSVLTVTQGSNQAIVNWGSFSIGQGNTVNFVQPDASSAILNRVTGSTSSTIAGALNANGQVYLINPNGITITSSGTVNAGGGFVASALDISDEDFLKGQYRFSGNGSSAQVSNEGVITIGRGGYAALIGGTVRNDGLIAVPLGKVGLGSGEQAVLDLSGDGFLQVALPTAEGAEGDGALIENSGQISAEGGTVVMKAATARNAARHAVNLSGSVEADSISGSDGEIVIGGGEGGKVTVSGKVSAKSTSGKGGKITVTGQQVALKGAEVDASGATGGGTVKIGGDWQGTGTTQRAETTSIDAASIIRADATQSGNGGTVVVWSDNLTTFEGLISAQGAGTGTGGEAEVSGKAVLSYTGHTDLGGPGGFGNLLLDPYNITISSGTASNSTGTTATGDDSVISVSTLVSALASANVTITTGASGSAGSQAGSITVADAVTWTSGSTLTLSAYGDIIVNANLTGGTGSSIVLRADNSGTGTGTVTFGSGVTATASGGVSLYYNPAGNDNSTVNGTSYSTVTDYSANAGTSTTITAYMLVNTVYDLQNMQNNLSRNYALGRDIDASATASWNSGAGFVPVGNSTTQFRGIFDGLGQVISGLIINRTSSFTGLFGQATNATLRNIGLSGGSVTGGTSTGALVGILNTGSTVSNSYSSATVTGTNAVGGLVGNVNNSKVEDSYSTGNVTASGNPVGGLAGIVQGSSASITRSYATGEVKSTAASGSANAGGLVGQLQTGATISKSYATGKVTVTASSAGGLVGSSSAGTITESYATGAVSGASNTGGLVGTGSSTLAISKSYATGTVSGTTNVGGLVGSITGTGSVSESYAVGAVSGTTTVGGLIGNLGTTASVTSSFFDSTTTGRTTGVGSNSAATGATALTTAEFQDTAGFMAAASTWSFTSTWAPSSTGYYPQLYAVTPVITVTGASKSSVYGSSTGTLSGFTSSSGGPSTYVFGPSGDSVTLTGISLAADASANAGTTATDFDLNISQISIGGVTYRVFVYGSGTTTVTARPISVTAEAQSVVYGDTLPTLTYTVGGSGLVNGDSLAGALATLASSTANTGTYAITLGTLGNSNYEITYTGADVTVTARAITVTADAKSMVYGDAVPALTYTVGGSGLVNGDTLTGALATVATSTSNVGSYTITQGTLDAPSNDTLTASGNYEITYVAGTLTVSKAALEVTAGATKTYDGQAYSGGDVSYSGFVNGETSAVLGGTLVYGGTSQGAVNAGSYTLTVSGLTSDNYDISYVDGSLTVDKAALEVTVTDATKTYDGLAYSGGNGLSYSGFVNNETASVLGGTLSYGGTSQNAVNAGDYTLTASGLTSDNYEITYVAGSLTVDKAALEVTVTDATKTYDGLAYSGGNGLSYSGFVNNETASVLGGTLSYGGTSQNAVNAGDYTLTASGLTSDNYEITYVAGSLTVDKAALEVTVTDATKTYDGLAYSGGNGLSYSGFVNNETASVLGGTLSYGGTSQNAVNAGDYTLTASGLTSDNYEITYVAGSLTVDKAALEVTVTDAVKTYDGLAYSGGNGLSYSGFVNNETASVLGGTLSYGGTSQNAVNAGSYTLTASGLSSDNYDISYVDGSLTVNKAALEVTVTDAVKTYDGLGFTGGNGVTYDGFVNGETASVLGGSLVYGGTSQNAVNAGSYTLTASGLTSGNYEISYVDGSLTVDKATLTVTANDAVKTYDGLAYSGGNGVGYSGFVNGETALVLGGTLVYGGTSQGAVNVGTYVLRASGLTSGNYVIAFVDGALTVQAVSAVNTDIRPVTNPIVSLQTSQSNPLMTSSQVVQTAPQEVFVASVAGGTGEAAPASGGAGEVTSEDLRISGALCVFGAGVAVACSAN